MLNTTMYLYINKLLHTRDILLTTLMSERGDEEQLCYCFLVSKPLNLKFLLKLRM